MMERASSRAPVVSRLAHWLPIAVAVAGVLASVALWRQLVRAEERWIASRFEADAEERASAIAVASQDALDAVYALAALHQASGDVTRDEFAVFARLLATRHPGLQALEWTPRVSAAQRDRHEAELRSRGVAGYEIRERDAAGDLVRAASRPVYYPVAFVEPLAGNERALGFDIGSEASRVAALELASRSGRLQLTGRLSLVQDATGGAGFIALLPVQGGFVLGVYRAAEIFEQALAPFGGVGLSLELVDVTEVHSAVSLYGSRAEEVVRERVVELDAGGRRWAVAVHSTRAYDESHHGGQPAAALGAGLLASALLGSLCWTLARRSARVERQVLERTEGLRTTERELQTQRNLLLSILDSLGEGVVAADGDGRFSVFNPMAERILGMGPLDGAAGGWSRAYGFLYPDLRTPVPEAHLPLVRALRGERVSGMVLGVRNAARPEGLFVEATSTPLLDESGQHRGGIVILRDVTDQRRTDEELLRYQERLELRQAVVNAVRSRMSIGTVIERALECVHACFPGLRTVYSEIDPAGQLRVVGSRQPETMASIAGLAIDLTAAPEYHAELRRGAVVEVSDVAADPRLAPFAEALAACQTRAMADAPVIQSGQLLGMLCFDSDVPRRWSRHEVEALRMVAEYLAIALDEARAHADRMRAEEDLRVAALHDRVTGLPNRVLFNDRLDQALRRTRRNPNYRFALLFLDLDRFKIINDSLGHEHGDRLLVEFAERLQRGLRDTDTASLLGEPQLSARLGGDEFAILLDGVRGVSEVEGVAERLQRVLSTPYRLGNHEVTLTVSIGIVTSEGSYERPEDMLRDADTAMFRAKAAGRARHVVFDERMHADVVKRLVLERQLRRAVEEGAFLAHYQPIYQLADGRITSFEALIRWRDPERGLVPPNDFIPIAEELGLIVPIGEWILLTAAQQLRAWRERFPAFGSLQMSVNVSKRQIAQPGLVEMVRRVLEETGLPPSALRLEITESVVMDTPHAAAPVLDELRALGVGLSMDDFGTGHSSLSCLQRFPIEVLKIDRAFIQSSERPGYEAVIQAIVTLAHTLRMTVVAEGIETQAQLELVTELGCDEAQGYLFSPPVEAEVAESLLAAKAEAES